MSESIRPEVRSVIKHPDVMSERMHSDEFVYWVKATIGLQITKEGLYHFIKNEINKMTESFKGDTGHFRRFLDKIVFHNRVYKQYMGLGRTKKFRWKFPTNCKSRACTIMFDTIIEKHAKQGAYTINWHCHKLSSTMEPSMYWWVVAKFYIPDKDDKIQDSTGPNEVDSLALFSLMANCKVFKNIWNPVLEVIDVRNKLKGSATNTINKADMIESFRKMKELLGEEEVNKTSKLKLDEIRKLEQEQLVLTNIPDNDHEMVAKALEMKEKALEYDIRVRSNAQQPTKYLQHLLQETSHALKQENQFYKAQKDDEKQKFAEKISDLQNEYSKLEMKYEDEQQNRKHKGNAYDTLFKKTLLDLREECESLKENYEEEYSSRLLLEYKFRRAEETIRELREEIETLRNQFRRAEETIRELREEIETLRNQKAGLLESVQTGAVVGGTTGLIGGPVGAVVGAFGGAIAGAFTHMFRR